MTTPYHQDLTQFSLDRFRHILETEELLPSRRMLQEDIPERFAALEAMGIRNLKNLTTAVSTKRKLAAFAQESGLPVDYLINLRRQTLVYTPKPIVLAKFPDVDPEHVERLAAVGVKQTRQLFEQGQSRDGRARLAAQTGVPETAILELVELSDLARAGWVGPIYARLIYTAGVESLDELARQSADDLFARLQVVNKEHGYTTASFTVQDMARTIELAQDLPKADL